VHEPRSKGAVHTEGSAPAAFVSFAQLQRCKLALSRSQLSTLQPRVQAPWYTIATCVHMICGFALALCHQVLPVLSCHVGEPEFPPSRSGKPVLCLPDTASHCRPTYPCMKSCKNNTYALRGAAASRQGMTHLLDLVLLRPCHGCGAVEPCTLRAALAGVDLSQRSLKYRREHRAEKRRGCLERRPLTAAVHAAGLSPPAPCAPL
jgi:hypothetical protein